MTNLSERLFAIFKSPDFLTAKAQANGIPLFIQTYAPSQEDDIRRVLDSLTSRLRNEGLTVNRVDLFDLVLAQLADSGLLTELIREEPSFTKAEILETLRNCSDPKGHLVPRLQRMICDGSQLTLITGSGRLFPFLRTHTILESLQPTVLARPIVLFFPGRYEQDLLGGSHLQLFGSIPSPTINNPYYRAANMEHVRI